MKDKKTIFLLLYFISYIGFSFGMTGFTPYLAKLGYAEWQRGLLLSSYAFTTIIFQLLFGFLADRYHTVKRFAILAFGILIVTTASFYLPNRPAFLVHIGLIAISGGLINTCCGLYDTWILASDAAINSKLSFIKAFGSVGWGVGSVLLTYILSQFGYRGLSLAVVCVGLIGVLLSSLSKDAVFAKVKESKVNISDYKSLLANKHYMLLVLILFLMYCVIICNNSTVVDKMISLGATDRQIAYKWSIQSFIEIPTYLFGSYLLQKYNHYSLLKLSAIALGIQFILFGFVDSIGVMIALGGLQILTTPLLLITSKTLIYRLTPSHMKSSGQLFALSIFTGVSSLVIPTSAGIITSIFSARITLLFASCLAVSALLLIFRLQRMSRKA